MRQRGFTLLEMLVVVAIVITVATIFCFRSGARPIAMRSALTEFDAALAYGKALAATSGNGATLAFAPTDSGFRIDVYSGRPTAPGALHPAGIAPFVLDGGVGEATMGAPPFALFLNSAGHASMAAFSGPAPAPMSSEPACPSGGRWVLTFTDSAGVSLAAQRSRTLACQPAE
jgi:prepilin-type N-terminal cleavage/methylation domain-containing protein